MDSKLKREVEAVRQLGSQMGYGHMMELASALWREDLQKTIGFSSGAFVPVCTYSIKKADIPMIEKSSNQYDKIVKNHK
jgi:hypothetical protein